MSDWGRILVSTRLEKQISPRFFQAWTKLIKTGLRQDDGLYMVAGKVAHAAQNDIVRTMLEGPFDSLLTLDSDADVAPDFLERFRTFEPGFAYDALQAFYPRRGWPPRAIWIKPNALGEMMECFVIDPDATEEVGIVGTHACLFRRELFERMLGDADPDTFDWFYYPRHVQMSEDGAFSQEARALGFKLGATTAVRAGHVTEITTTWDTYQEYLDITGKRKLIERYGELAHEIAAFTGESAEMVLAKATHAGANVSEPWKEHAPANADEERAFYGCKDNGYLYDLLNWNCQPLYERILMPLYPVSSQRVLVIGCGLGTEADVMADRNRVDVFELPGVLKDFAMRRLGSRVNWLHGDTLGEALDGDDRYDLVVAIDTLEHVHPSELPFVLADIDMVLAPHGALYAHNNFGQQDVYPMHHDNGEYFNGWWQSMDMVQEGEYLWRKS
jgi:SAM-dependent methyltransferase